MSVMAIFQQLPTRCLQNDNGAQSNSGNYDCRPENETAETGQHAPWELGLVGVQYVITAAEAQPFNSDSS